MKKLLILILFPVLCWSQVDDCGERPIKPIQAETQTKKDYKKSAVYVEYKKTLKIWKSCMSPLAISERDEKKTQESIKDKAEISGAKFIEKIKNPCGERPDKPERAQGQKHDDYRKTAQYIEYKKVLKTWKSCNSPPGISKRNQETMDEDFEKIRNAIASQCGEKPIKPFRAKGVNNEEYKTSPEYVDYRKNLKIWKNCSSATKKNVTAGPCGEKPTKPFREEGIDHEKYRETPEHIEYQKRLKVWRDCNTEINKKKSK